MLKRPTSILGWIAWFVGGSFVALCGCLGLGFAIGGSSLQQQAAQGTAQARITPTEEDRVTPTVRSTPAPTADVMATAKAGMPGYVSRATLGDDWPLSIEEGILTCSAQREILLTTSQGTYAVNGTARGRMEENRWKDINEVTVEGSAPGLIKDLSPLLDVGLALCN